MREHLFSDRFSQHVFSEASAEFRVLSNIKFIGLLQDPRSAATKFQVKLKESMYIKWDKPDLNQQVKHKPATFVVSPSMSYI